MSVNVNEPPPAMDRLGDDIMGATEAGKWVGYVYRNPETGEEGRKHSRAVRHDGLIIGSGWYEKE